MLNSTPLPPKRVGPVIAQALRRRQHPVLAPATRALPLLAVLWLAGCGERHDTPAAASTAVASSAPQEAVSRIGDVTIRASVVQTSTLPEAVAMQYGIARSDRLALVLVAVRQGPEAGETSLPATITATAIDLRGRRQDIPMRELRTGELLDYVGTAEIDLPDTVRFELVIARTGGARSTMQFSREFYPR